MHTPGPWKIIEDAQGPCMIMHPTKEGVAIASLTSIFSPTNGFIEIEAPGAPERTANAKLIAAAPELLEALRDIIEIGKRDLSNPKYDSYFESAKQAILKATK